MRYEERLLSVARAGAEARRLQVIGQLPRRPPSIREAISARAARAFQERQADPDLRVDHVIRRIPARVGQRSAVGITGAGAACRPLTHGNYFEFDSGHYCVNMWYENLAALVEALGLDTLLVDEFIDEGGPQLTVRTGAQLPEGRRFCVVTDPRIPPDWLCKEAHFNGCGRVSTYMQLKIERFVEELSYYRSPSTRFRRVSPPALISCQVA